MFSIKPPTNKLKEICKALGEPYTINTIDGENVIYRNLENGFDFEVSGLDNHRKNSFKATLYIWQIKDNRVVETIHDIKSLIELKDCLGSAATKYLNLPVSNLDTIQNQH